MKTYQADQIKNIALLGNSGSGKTTLAEAMLFNGGIIESNRTIEFSLCRVVFEKVSKRFGTGEVVDTYYFNIAPLESKFENVPADSSESVDCNFCRHRIFSFK